MTATAAAPGTFSPPANASAPVELRNASRWYGNVVAVNDVSATVSPGITGLLGPNGAGKSTVLHMMAGLLRPSAGSITIHGVAATHGPDVYRHVGLVPEREALPDYLTGMEFVHAAARLHQLPDHAGAALRAIETVDMTAAMHRKVGTYSKGMKQRIKVAGALVHDPAIVLLDEPFNGMDPRQRLHMMEVLRARADAGTTVVISSHILEELNDLADRVLVMLAGRLAASGHSREIRRLMTDRPHTFRMRSSNDRRLAAALLIDSSVVAVELTEEGLMVRTGERGTMTRHVARAAKEAGVRITEIRPTDESLESVFAYLVNR